MIELSTNDGKKLYAWIAHVNHSSQADCYYHWLDLIDEFSEVIKRDTGLDEYNLHKIASHTTIAKIYYSVDAYINDEEPIGFGVSVCSDKDQFSRKNGRIRAIKRALGKMRLFVARDGIVYPQNNAQNADSTQPEERLYECV